MECNTRQYGFLVQAKNYVEEIQGYAYELYHEQSGARVMYLENEDENKGFSIGFKTIPEDSTGIFHILEHSVLNGSRKYPMKETFVELMKGSMKNYLNAMTFPDKTLYPFATVNEKDYLNLMDVYLDAVFHPLIYTDKEIFEQEGWHYEWREGEKEPFINGVVYNEMKGVFSSVENQLSYEVNKAMFPDSIYGYVSGGHPEEIPCLTYEKFLSMHKRYYSSDNCYLVLYGKMEIEEKLAFIDREYLGKMSKRGIDYPVAMQPPIKNLDYRCTYHLENKTGQDIQSVVAYNLGTIKNRDEPLAIYILIGALMGNNEAPLKKALLEANLGADVSVNITDGILQPYLSFTLENADVKGEKEFQMMLQDAVTLLCKNGLDRELLIAEINNAEFMMKEKSGGIPDGILYAIHSMTGWIHGLSPLLYLKYNDCYKRMRQQLEEGYFEELLQKIILDNPYQVKVSMFPEEEMDINLKKTEVTSQKLKLLSPLTIEDLKNKGSKGEDQRMDSHRMDSLEEKTDTYTRVYHEMKTNGISYVTYYFDLGAMSAKEIPYVQLLSELVGGLDTLQRPADKLSILLSTWFGSSGAQIECFTDVSDVNQVMTKFALQICLLDSNLPYAVSISEEMLLETVFTQKEEIRKRMEQTKLWMERNFVSEGDTYASIRVSSYYSLDGMCRERSQGYSYYQFLCELLENYDQNYQGLVETLLRLQENIFRRAPVTVSFSGSKDRYQEFCQVMNGSRFIQDCHRPLDSTYYKDKLPKITREAFVIESNVSYVTLGAKGSYTGKGLVLSRILSFDYLWRKLRVEGGAYGGGMQVGSNGNVLFYSYRDPHVKETYEVYQEMIEYLSHFSVSEEEMTSYIIGTMAQYDTILKPRGMAKTLDWRYFSKKSEAMREQEREEIRTTSVEDIKSLAHDIKNIINSSNYCTFGNKEAIQEAKEMFDCIYDLR